MIDRWPLTRRLSVAFAALLLVCCAASVALQWQAREQHEQATAQRLSRGLAAHIAMHSALLAPGGANPQAVQALFGQLMVVNPSVEVYLLAPDGRIRGQAAPPGHLKREHVDLRPVRRLLAGEALPILGDDPRSDSGQKVFDATRLVLSDGHEAGYLYMVLLGEAHDALAADAARDGAWRTTLWAMVLVAALGLLAGAAALRWITRPLRLLTAEVDNFDTPSGDHPWRAQQALPDARDRNEITRLRSAFAHMAQRMAEQVKQLNAQDQQRRELVANISHDLRTPLTSLHGYLETLRVKAPALSQAERLRYLDIALAQSRKVSRLAQELFELARLEYGVVQPESEPFLLPELVQDVLQKFELASKARQQRLVTDIPPGLPAIHADLGMIERVLTNLLDNAIRHTPPGGTIEWRLRPAPDGVEVQLSDTGPGVAEHVRKHLFTRPLFSASEREGPGGLGLVIVRRILQLHGSDIRLLTRPERGAVFRFCLFGPTDHKTLNSA
jgi:signal transduction histidine kinase